jgi:hypothetical protein
LNAPFAPFWAFREALEAQASPQDLVDESGALDVTAFRGVTDAWMT